MTERGKMARATLAIGTGQGVAALAVFARNVLIARLITREDFGIAATFAMTVELLETLSSFAVDRLLVQAEDGDDEAFQRSVQLFEALRAVVNAVLLFFLAGPIAAVFNVPGVESSYRWLALVPLLRGLAHMDMKRLQREFRFGPLARVTAVSSLLAALAAYPLGVLLPDYRALLWVLLIQSGSYWLGSHLVAQRPYRLGWDRALAARILSFGWPLLLNGLLLFLIFQGDRFVIATARQLFDGPSFSLADLGVYSVAFALTSFPVVRLVQVANAVLLPAFSRGHSAAHAAGSLYASGSQLLACLAALYGIGFVLVGEGLVTLVYGSRYADAAGFIGWLGAMQAVRILRPLPTQACIARADTRSVMWANVVRNLALPGILIVTAQGWGLAVFASCGFAGELLALLFSILRLHQLHGVPIGAILRPASVAAAGVGAAAALSWGVPGLGPLELMSWALALGLISFGGFFALFPAFRRICLDPSGAAAA